MAYTAFIPQNVAPLGARRIGIYDANGNQVGQFPLGRLAPPNTFQKLYSFGAVSDIHLCKNNSSYDTSQGDFVRALDFFNDEEKVNFICVCGDLTVNGGYEEYKAEEFGLYKKNVDEYSPNTPVYAIAGNHDAPLFDNTHKTEASIIGLTHEDLIPYTGRGLFYSFTQGNDIFIMVGEWAWSYYHSFSTAELQWLYETLEANRNKRCFVFQHLLSFAGSGNPYGDIDGDKEATTDILGSGANTSGKVFLSLMRHYKNCIWFHGHSHTVYECQEDNSKANYDRELGIHSVHIPSLAVTRTWNNVTQLYDKHDEGGSQGYVVDVYENGIHLRGRDFVKKEFLPIASYWLDTTLQTIPAGTYKDSTGTIKTQGA